MGDGSPRFDDVESGGYATDGGRQTVRDLLYDAERRLAGAGVPSPQADAAWLMAWVLDVPRSRLFLHDEPRASQRVQFEKAVARRLTRVPLQHITGRAAFRRLEVSVGPGVFVPRPETELIAEAGVRALRDAAGGTAVDLCAGSGVIGLSLALEAPGSTVFLVEKDEAALEWTERNVEEYRAATAAGGSSLEVVGADATEVASPGQSLGHLAGAVDVVCANPPYIPDAMVPREIEVRDHDPAGALYAGADGLDVVRGIARTAAVLLRPGGLLAIEHADTQGPDGPAGGVLQILRQTVIDEDMATHIPGLPGTSVFTGVTDRRDLAGLPRFTLATRAEF